MREAELLGIQKMKNRLLFNLKTIQITEKRNKFKGVIQEIDQIRFEQLELETQGSIYDNYD
eukprot:CAMPEP_0205828432 /NCGR_PEP_ID=MMETSP0206-20130828/35104_1 /ASSEMBLY_ACC=CAM_ASM_000279 /TAXON_ID=36767 /ORGANISM="Euplotes focardii, Strain TN1" /LENGTH=60 /DNA_ID=CAMNT_0053130245 /DNA_START=344 /DNA_END=526 /DNA_ORIENTATION=+